MRLRLLTLLELLNKKSDIAHPLNIHEILDYLKDKKIQTRRQTIYDDIQALKDHGYPIRYTQTPSSGYYLEHRLLSKVEIKVLCDVIDQVEPLSVNQSTSIIKKLCSILNDEDQVEIMNNRYISNNKTDNEIVLHTISIVQQAISNYQKITFRYFDIVNQNIRKYRKDGQSYETIPYAIVFDNQKYYCICYSEKYNNFSHYRLDKMDKVKRSEETIQRHYFDIHDYMAKTFNMMAGQPETIIVRFNNNLYNQVSDRLGTLTIKQKDDDTFTVIIHTIVSTSFLSWLLQFQQDAIILHPKNVIEQMKQLTTQLYRHYNHSTSYDEH